MGMRAKPTTDRIDVLVEAPAAYEAMMALDDWIAISSRIPPARESTQSPAA